ncbi:hypothetical protein ACQEXU_03610 [Vibrio sp. TRT 21S02]|uniref:hypothetical protein n=1 Tax=Vibrio sp. TRT 21S02 TaxID=3418507 RepID=UPI003CEAF901
MYATSTWANNASNEPNETDLCHSQQDQSHLFDKAFHYLNTKFCQPALWFDNFFVDERADEDGRAGTVVRWYNDFSYIENEGYQFKTKLRFRLHLPKATKRLKLVFESDEKDDLTELLPSTRSDAEETLGLRYDWYSEAKQSFNIKVTARPGIEARYRYTYPFSDDTLARITQKIYQKKRLTGESTQLDIDHSLNPTFLLRWTNLATYEDDIKGWNLGSGVTLFQHISDKQAINYQASISGTNRPYHYLENTRIAISYRQNIWRDWLYYEIRPEYNWKEEPDVERYQEAMVTLRFELLFHNL